MEASLVEIFNILNMEDMNDNEITDTCDIYVEDCEFESHSSTQVSDMEEEEAEVQLISSENAVVSNRLLFERKYSVDKDCPVCMVNMKGNVVGHSPCGHTVCRDCLLNQINKSNYYNYMYKCPLCRYDLKTFLEPIQKYNYRENIRKMMLTYP